MVIAKIENRIGQQQDQETKKEIIILVGKRWKMKWSF
jgi:hypothetical protein